MTKEIPHTYQEPEYMLYKIFFTMCESLHLQMYHHDENMHIFE